MGFLKFMRSTGYALHGLAYLASQDKPEPIQLREIAGALNMPENYMAKIFQVLSRAGLVHASRGSHRGYRLARPAAEISLLHVVELFEGPVDDNACFLGEIHCPVSEHCFFGGYWGAVKKMIRGELNDATLEQFLNHWPIAEIGEEKTCIP